MSENNRSKWNADAEMSMMGFPIAVESTAHLTHMVRYCLKVLKSDCYPDNDSLNYRANEVVANATTKYNSSKDKSIKWFVVNTLAYDCAVLMTFVRDKGALTTSTGRAKSSGILAWVENLDYPDCSELGYVFFAVKNGKTVRIG